LSFVYGVVAPSSFEGDALLYAVRRGEILVADASDGAASIPHGAGPRAIADLGIHVESTQFLGALDGAPCFAMSVADDASAPPGYRFAGLRALYDKLPEADFAIAGTASQIAYWDRLHRFCSRCASPLAPKAVERAKRCEACAVDYFPRVQPAVIVLVHDGPRILMARSPGFPQRWYALVAGFVEPGETFEECAKREVREETGVAIDEVRYFGSQPWAFPHQVMVGFFARWIGGDVVIDRTELEDARWFEARAMPPLPPAISIARRMIDAWLDEQRIKA
jgi:NAD+ diphosphatase